MCIGQEDQWPELEAREYCVGVEFEKCNDSEYRILKPQFDVPNARKLRRR